MTGLAHFCGFRMNRTERSFVCLGCHILLSFASPGYASAADYTACPTVSPATSAFSGGRIYQGSVVSIERNADDQTISLSIYRPYLNGCEKTIFARYSIEGGAPSVDYLFLWISRANPISLPLFIGM